jgi:hypothetical protein
MVVTASAHTMKADRCDPVLFPDFDVDAADVAMLREVLGGLAGRSAATGMRLAA